MIYLETKIKFGSMEQKMLCKWQLRFAKMHFSKIFNVDYKLKTFDFCIYIDFCAFQDFVLNLFSFFRNSWNLQEPLCYLSLSCIDATDESLWFLLVWRASVNIVERKQSFSHRTGHMLKWNTTQHMQHISNVAHLITISTISPVVTLSQVNDTLHLQHRPSVQNTSSEEV